MHANLARAGLIECATACKVELDGMIGKKASRSKVSIHFCAVYDARKVLEKYEKPYSEFRWNAAAADSRAASW
jgi:hypothetical protein